MKSPESPNPFVYSRPLRADEAIPRPGVVTKLVTLADGGHNATLIGQRRYGKTSVLNQLRVKAEKELDMVTVLVDLSDVLSAADLSGRLHQAYRTIKRPLSRFVEDNLAGAGITTPIGGHTLPGRGAADPLETVHALLDLPLALHERTGRRVLVAFDELQALLEARGLDGVLRSHLQHHGDIAAYVFSGSEPSLLRKLFEDRARPLFGQAELLPLGPVRDEAATRYVRKRLSDTGRSSDDLVLPLVRATEGHPQRLMLIAHHFWVEVGAHGSSLRALKRAYETAMRQVEPELRTLWDGLTPNGRRVLRAIAANLPPYGADAARLTGLGSASSAQAAVDSALGAGILREGDGELRIVDPLFARWVLRRGGARPTLYVVPTGDGTVSVTDGPSFAFTRSTHQSIDEAEREADSLMAALGGGGDIVVYDSDDPNDLPEWATR